MSDQLSRDVIEAEAAKYQHAWTKPVYRVGSHSLALWHRNKELHLFPQQFATAVDIGCGRGVLFGLWNDQGKEAYGIDIAKNALDAKVRVKWGHRFKVQPIWEMDFGHQLDVGVCTDVMEHIPPQFVDQSLQRIAATCRTAIFKIAHVPCVWNFGGPQLHLTIQNSVWWRDCMKRIGGTVEFLGTVIRVTHKDSLIRWTQ